MDAGRGLVQTLAVAPGSDEHSLRALTGRRMLGVVLLALLVGACARPAGQDETATAATAPSTSSPAATSQGTEALRRAHLEVERFCMIEFPDHCAGVVLVLGQEVAGITVEPVGKDPSPQDLAGFRRRLEQLTGEKMSDQEFASFMELFEQIPQPSPQQLAELAGLAGIPGFDRLGKNQMVVYRRPLAALDAAVRQRFPGQAGALRFAGAAYSFKYLDALGRRVLTEQLDKGVRISEVSPETDGSGVRVVTPDARRVRRLLQQRYGPAVIVMEGPPQGP